MKYRCCLILLLTYLPFVHAQDTLQSSLKKATVYLEGAQLTREITLDLKTGKNHFVINQLSPHIDHNSIQVSNLGDLNVSSVGFNSIYRKEGNASEESKTINQKIETLEKKIVTIVSELTGLQEERQLLQNNRQMPSNGNTMTVEQLKAMASYYKNRLSEIHQKENDKRKQIASIREQINELNSTLSGSLSINSRNVGIIDLILQSSRSQRKTVTMTYVTREAAWIPHYEVRAKDTETDINLTFKATVFQNTGQDWKDIAMELSTGDPFMENNFQKLSPKKLGFVRSTRPTYANRRTNRK